MLFSVYITNFFIFNTKNYVHFKNKNSFYLLTLSKKWKSFKKYHYRSVTLLVFLGFLLEASRCLFIPTSTTYSSVLVTSEDNR